MSTASKLDIEAEPTHRFGEDNDCTFGCQHGEDIERDQYTRPVWTAGERTRVLTRVSTLSKSLEGTSDALMSWRAARTLEGVVRNRGLLDSASMALSHDDEDELRRIADQAAEVGRSTEAAMAGTANHDALLSGLLGEELEFASPEVQASLAALREVLAEHKLTPILTEQFVANLALAYGGSYDLLAQHEETGRFHVCDVKTGAKMHERRFTLPVAIQLAGYAHGQRWCPQRGWLRDPPVDRAVGYLLSVPLDQGAAYLDPIDLDVGWEGMQLAAWARTLKKKKVILKGSALITASGQ